MKKLTYIISSLLLVLSLFSVNTIAAQQSIFDTSSVSSLKDKSDEFISVDQAFAFDFAENGNKVTITFDITPGYYLYKKRFKIKSKNAIIKPVQLPQGLPHEDEYFGAQEVYKKQVTFDIIVEQADDDAELSIRYQGCAEKGLCYPPQSKHIPLDSTTASSVLTALNGNASHQSDQNKANIAVNNAPVSEQNKLASMLKQDNIWLTLVAFFLGGLLLSFTPCVFPMYPILTGIIVGQGSQLTTKKAFSLSFTYVQGMAITYTLLGVIVAVAGAQFQAMFQHPAVLIGLSILFVFLALSMFGFFNLALPASWQNSLNNLSNKQKGGSYYGVLSMGVISGLVASPCTTAPLTGALLYISQTGDLLLGASALYALSIGMGIPLLILGSTGGKLLPKAGAWMNIVKNIFGFLLLAVPIFLLERIISSFAIELLWLALVLSCAIYFYVVNSSTSKGFWYGVRSLLIFIVLVFAINLLQVKLMPTLMTSPMTTSAKVEQNSQHLAFIKVNNLSQLLDQVDKANQQGKTVMVDLYADWCVACKEFEQLTFNTEQVKSALKQSVLLQVDLTDTGSKESVELMKHFNVFGLPSILFFDRKGHELSQQRVTGFMDATSFSQHILAIFKP